MRLNSLNQLIQGRQTTEGSWRLGKSHDLQYWHRRAGGQEEILLKTELLAASPAGLSARILEQTQDGDSTGRVLTLRGRWQADPQNRLTFLAEREQGRFDRLTLAGGWEINDQNELLYRYYRRDQKKKDRELHTLTFRGRWDLPRSGQLTYVLDADSDSAFRFRGTFQTDPLAAKKGELRYQLGVEVEGRHRLQTVTLFGKWKLSRDLDLQFDVASGRERSRTISFGAAYSLGAGRTVTARLVDRRGEPLGGELTLTQSFLKRQGEAFARLRKSLEETAVEAGVRFRW